MTETHEPHSTGASCARHVAIAAAIACCVAIPSSAAAAPAGYSGSSADGDAVFFATSQSLVPGDTDHFADVYERTFDASGTPQYTTREISTGPTGGNDAFDATFAGASADGTKVFFTTQERLVGADTDQSDDVYERSGGVTTLVSTGPGGGNGGFNANYGVSSDDGSVVIFTSDEQLTGADTDSSRDIYLRNTATSTTVLVSTGSTGGNGAQDASFPRGGLSSDGSKVFFRTSEQLTAADTDSFIDIYKRDLTAVATTLMTPSGTCPAPGPCEVSAIFGGASADGSKVFFETGESLAGGDSDDRQDVYESSGGAATLASTGSTGGNGDFNSGYVGGSGDGSVVLFTTSEALTAADLDSENDIYQRSGGTTTLVSTGSSGGPPAFFHAVSTSGATVVFSTTEQLSGSDTDGSADVYSRTGGTTTLRSTGPAGGNGAFNAIFDGASPSAGEVFFHTQESLVSQDTDTSTDVYESSAGGTSLVSIGPTGGNGSPDAAFSGVSGDGGHAFFVTAERLTSDDLDTETDVYDRSAGGTVLVSVGNSVPLGPGTPSLTGTNPGSPSSSTTPAIIGQSDPATLVKLYSSPDCSGPPAGTGTNQDLSAPGIVVTVAADSTTTFHATATDAQGDTSDCSTSTVTYQQVTSPPAEPVLSGTLPSSPANANQPSVTGSAPAGSTVALYAEPSCSGPAVGSGSAGQLAGGGIQVSVADNSTTTFHAAATLAGQTSPCSSSAVTYVEDSQAPALPKLSTPGSPANDNSPLISGSAEEGSSVAVYDTEHCSGTPVARGTAAELAAGLRVQVADDTTTAYRAIATDTAGNASGCPSGGASYVEDSTRPQTEITFGPGVRTLHRRPVFRFTDASRDDGTRFECQLDKGPWKACQPPQRLARLRRGKHVFRVKGTDVAGNSETIGAKRRFKVVVHR